MGGLDGVLFDRSPAPALVLNATGQIVRLNREALRALAVAAERVVGHPLLALVHPEDRDRAKEIFLRVLSGQEREWNLRFSRGDGVTRAQRVRAVPLEDAGRIRQIVLFMQEVEGTRAGRPDARQLQTLMENLPGQFVAVLDTAGLLRYASGLARTHFRDDVEWLGRPYAELVTEEEENLSRLAQMLMEIADGNDWGGTHWHVRADGSSFPALTVASPHRDPRTGRVLGALLVGRDVAADHAWRLRAERSERMADVGRLVGGVASEFREMLSRIETALGLGGRQDPMEVAYSVPRELARAGALVGSVEALAGIPWTPRPVWLSLPHEVEGVVTELSDALAHHGATVTVEPPEGTVSVHGDPPQIRALLRALLVNAAESAVDGEGVRISVGFSTTVDGTRVRVLVRDDGVGLQEDDVHRTTEPFFTTKDGHAGLGLAVARAVAAGHGGTLSLESPGRGLGALITVELPKEAPGTTVRFRPAPLVLRQSKSVLIVDDEATVRLSVRRFLERVGYEVREAWSGRSALAQITVETPPDLVITDLRMGDGSGAWFMQQLAWDFPDLLRRTVMVTGVTQEEELAQLARQTGCPVLRKPLEMAHLLDILDELISRE